MSPRLPINSYHDLLEYYDELFPVEQKRIDFIESLTKKSNPPHEIRPLRVLEIGCATGTTALSLAQRGMDLVGIDRNEAMIQSANRRNREPKSNARFFCMDMLESGAYFPPDSFDMILCLGNSLAHLHDSGEVRSLFRQIQVLLADGGAFVFELLNYDRVTAELKGEMSPVESGRVKLIRKYNTISDGHICLSTIILSLSGHPVFFEDTFLYPVASQELRSLLGELSFSREDFYRNFDRTPLDREAVNLVGIARKE
jgi:SAM-dependent methyltransferase